MKLALLVPVRNIFVNDPRMLIFKHSEIKTLDYVLVFSLTCLTAPMAVCGLEETGVGAG